MNEDTKITPARVDRINRQMSYYADSFCAAAMKRPHANKAAHELKNDSLPDHPHVVRVISHGTPAAPQGLALARFFTRSNYWDRVYRGPALVHSVRNPNHWKGPRASA